MSDWTYTEQVWPRGYLIDFFFLIFAVGVSILSFWSPLFFCWSWEEGYWATPHIHSDLMRKLSKGLLKSFSILPSLDTLCMLLFTWSFCLQTPLIFPFPSSHIKLLLELPPGLGFLLAPTTWGLQQVLHVFVFSLLLLGWSCENSYFHESLKFSANMGTVNSKLSPLWGMVKNFSKVFGEDYRS